MIANVIYIINSGQFHTTKTYDAAWEIRMGMMHPHGKHVNLFFILIVQISYFSFILIVQTTKATKCFLKVSVLLVISLFVLLLYFRGDIIAVKYSMSNTSNTCSNLIFFVKSIFDNDYMNKCGLLSFR